jgi:hypothetical protein
VIPTNQTKALPFPVFVKIIRPVCSLPIVLLSDVVLKRLAFIRYLYDTSVRQSYQPEPMSSVSLLSFHDGVELFLQLASEYVGMDKDASFMEYWENTKSKLPGEGLTQKASMKRLNGARVALKHYGRLPSRLDLDEYRTSTTTFFRDNCLTVFGVDFDNISLVHLIQYDLAKKKLDEARKLMEQDKIEESLQNIALAFDMIISDY